MNEEKSWTELYNKYPSLFVNIHKSPMESCMSFGIECDFGWYDIINSLCWKICNHEENIARRAEYKQKENPKYNCEYNPVKFDQIKQKFGALTIYHSGGDDYVSGLIEMAEGFSYTVCEVCGNKGSPNKKGWIKTTCEAHGLKT